MIFLLYIHSMFHITTDNFSPAFTIEEKSVKIEFVQTPHDGKYISCSDPRCDYYIYGSDNLIEKVQHQLEKEFKGKYDGIYKFRRSFNSHVWYGTLYKKKKNIKKEDVSSEEEETSEEEDVLHKIEKLYVDKERIQKKYTKLKEKYHAMKVILKKKN